VAGRDHLVAAPKLIAIVDPSHRRTARYAHSTASGTESARSSPARRLSEVGPPRQPTGSKRHRRPSGTAGAGVPSRQRQGLSSDRAAVLASIPSTVVMPIG
jgi:hypothetical protein